MITYEQAKEIATKAKSGIDTALEYKDAYVFYNSKVNKSNMDDNEVVILKSNGKRVSMTEYVVGTKDTSKPKKLKF